MGALNEIMKFLMDVGGEILRDAIDDDPNLKMDIEPSDGLHDYAIVLEDITVQDDMMIIRILAEATKSNFVQIKKMIRTLPVMVANNLTQNEAENLRYRLNQVGAVVSVTKYGLYDANEPDYNRNDDFDNGSSEDNSEFEDYDNRYSDNDNRYDYDDRYPKREEGVILINGKPYNPKKKGFF